MIPKIIHQTGPDEKKWHPIWKECSQSWKNTFPDFQYVYWTDDDLRNLVKDQYSEFLELYDSFKYHIMRVDFARFCILHSYGGIYADLDVYCYKNFYNLMRKDLYILESWSEWEKVQNSLMISNDGNEFWIKCMKLSQYTFQNIKEETLGFNDYVLECCGPKMISRNLDSTVKFLPKELFNPKLKHQFNWGNYDTIKYENAINDYHVLNEEDTQIITRHYLTGKWS